MFRMTWPKRCGGYKGDSLYLYGILTRPFVTLFGRVLEMMGAFGGRYSRAGIDCVLIRPDCIASRIYVAHVPRAIVLRGDASF